MNNRIAEHLVNGSCPELNGLKENPISLIHSSLELQLELELRTTGGYQAYDTGMTNRLDFLVCSS